MELLSAHGRPRKEPMCLEETIRGLTFSLQTLPLRRKLPDVTVSFSEFLQETLGGIWGCLWLSGVGETREVAPHAVVHNTPDRVTSAWS